MKLEHNKIKNTGILFEILIRQITTDTLQNKKSPAADIIKKHFSNSEIAREFGIYHILSSNKNLSEGKAESLINSCLHAHSTLDKERLKKEKYALISDIRKNYDLNEFLRTKISNYKQLASTFLLFEMHGNQRMDPEKYSKYKFTILESISEKKDDEESEIIKEFNSYDRGTRNLIYRIALQKFNEKYKNFDENQKQVLKEYMVNATSSKDLRKFVNERVQSISVRIHDIIKKTDDEVRKVKLNEVKSFLYPIPESRPVEEKDVQNLLYFYELLKEYDEQK